MEQYDLESSIKHISSQGGVLSPREYACIHAALTKLRLTEKLSEVYFWGRISGDEDDYYIAYALKQSPKKYPNKSFYWMTSQSGFVLSELPGLSHEQACLARTFDRGTFRGKPSKVLGLSDEEQEAAQAEEDQEKADQEAAEQAAKEAGTEAPKPAPKPGKPVRLTELQRLAFAVRQIDFETSVVPVGSYLVSENKTVMPDRTFKGLSMTDAKHLISYRHFRHSVDPEGLRSKAGDDAIYQTNFLDSLDGDEPRGCWVIRSDAYSGISILRSLLWPGYSAFHIPNTPHHGGAYLGNGLRNNDLAFLLM